MSEHDVFELLFDISLDLDEEGLERSEEAIIGDRNIKLLLRENRIALAKGKSIAVKTGDSSLNYYDIPLSCVVQSHPECRFRWARLMVDFSSTRRACIRDMSPREIRGDNPVELKTHVGAALKFQTVAKVLSTELKSEHTASRTVYYPEIISSGPGFTKGYWDFLAMTSDYLHADRELRILVSAPPGEILLARFNLRAKVRLSGIAGLIPLLARSGEINETYRLD